MSIVCGSLIVAVGGTVKGSVVLLLGLNGDQPTPCDWSTSCATPQPNGPPESSENAVIAAPPRVAAQSRRSATFLATVPPAGTVSDRAVTRSQPGRSKNRFP